jgi:hypothetical protein
VHETSNKILRPFQLGCTLALLMALTGLTVAQAAPAPAPARGISGIWLLDQSIFDKVQDNPAPYRPRVSQAAARLNDTTLSDDGKKCLPIGFPSMVTNEFAMQILETPGQVTMISEASNLTRAVYLNKKTHKTGQDPGWNGDAIGHWEGKALVVDTVNLNDRISHMPFSAPAPPSLTTHIVERYHLENGGTVLVDAMTFEDPNLLLKPWTIIYKYHRAAPGAVLWEYVCEVDAAGWSERFNGDPEFKSKSSAK